MSKNCPFCYSPEHQESYLPDTVFNTKTFNYIACKKCQLIYLHPFPTEEDYVAMYPTSYQGGLNKQIISDDKKMPGLRFAYGKHFDLIKKFAPGNKILDYGCGQANFVFNAEHKNIKCDGVEYNPLHVDILKKEMPASKFYVIEDFLKNEAEKYDVIRLSNVLEHLDDPAGIIKKLASKLTTNGILLIEGPIETNASFALFIRKIYFKYLKALSGNKKANHPPTHIFFSNAANQRDFFKKNQLQELYFEVKECEWPFPENLDEVKGPGAFFKWLIAKTSIASGIFNKNLGNTFIYAGKKS